MDEEVVALRAAIRLRVARDFDEIFFELTGRSWPNDGKHKDRLPLAQEVGRQLGFNVVGTMDVRLFKKKTEDAYWKMRNG